MPETAMRSSITIFLLGLVLGSTLGIGGIWTQVAKPAYEQIHELEQREGVMQGALDEAGETLRDVAKQLRTEESGGDAPAPIPTGNIVPRTEGIAPSGITPATTTRKVVAVNLRSNPGVLADRLDKVAARLDAAKKTGE
jgi:hypothetical protein